MPKKTAETDPMQQIKLEDVIGSGPFVFKGDEWKPGEKVQILGGKHEHMQARRWGRVGFKYRSRDQNVTDKPEVLNVGDLTLDPARHVAEVGADGAGRPRGPHRGRRRPPRR